MKKPRLTDHLSLSTEVVASLSEEQQQEIEGGVAASDTISCIIFTCNRPAETEVATEE